ncbi:RNA-binding protein 39 [Geranomyces variabilis]|uniref:RNA-binding protein 39 n=1 Tax=Geranomyces variabilis TaxID=109894 RepID=A0AAD5TWV5_9FUNG|nr:RNA-binding protein 39 [Geranomyces variabilis]
MVMELDVEQLLEAPFRKEPAKPVEAPISPPQHEASPRESEEPRNGDNGSGDDRSVAKESRRRSSREHSSRDERRSSSRKHRRSRSRTRSPRQSSKDDESRHRRSSREAVSHRDRRRRSRSRSPSRRNSRTTDRRRSRSPRDYRTTRRGPPSPPDRYRKSSGNFGRVSNGSPELDEYERDKRTVFVMQLAARLKQEELFDFFAPAGKVRDARIIADRNSRRSKGVGYVEFYEVESVAKAIAMTGEKLLGIPIIAQHTESEKNRIAAEAAAAARAEIPITRVYIGSLHFSLTEDDLKAVFEPFGPIDKIDLHKDPLTGKSRGYAFVNYRNPEDAKQAMDKMNGFEIMGRAIKVGHITDKAAAPAAAPYSLDDGEMNGLNNVSRQDLMAKLARDESLLAAGPTFGLGGNVPKLLPTRNVLLKNMFNLLEVQTEHGWDQELKEDVSSECEKYGTLRHVGIDTEALDGRIYMKYNSIPEAEAAVKALDGRFFAGKKIEAVYVPDLTYNGRFPEAAFE